MNFGIGVLTNQGNRDLFLNAKIILLVIAATVFIINIPFPVFCPIFILVFGIGLGIFLASILAPEDFKFLSTIYLIGFSVRAFLAFLFYNVSFLFKAYCWPGFLFANDGLGYSEQGWQIYKFAERGIEMTRADFLVSKNLILYSGTVTEYDYFSAFVYSITGKSLLSLFFISSLAGALAALFVYLIAKQLFSKNVARVSCLLAFFWPSFIMWSTQNLREPVTAMFLCILLWSIFYMRGHSFLAFLPLVGISAWVLYKLYFPFAVVISFAFLFTGLFLLLNSIFKNRLLTALTITVLFLLPIFIYKERVLSSIFEGSDYALKGKASVFAFLDIHRRTRAYGSLSIFQNVDLSTFAKMTAFLPLIFLFAIFAPFPWQLGSIWQKMAAPETIIFYILFPFTLKGAIFAYKKRFNKSILPLSIIVAVLVFLALVEGNAGTLFRHRALVFHLLFIFTAVGLTLKRKKIDIRYND